MSTPRAEQTDLLAFGPADSGRDIGEYADSERLKALLTLAGIGLVLVGISGLLFVRRSRRKEASHE